MDLGGNDRMNESINQPIDAMGVLCMIILQHCKGGG
jgi:hypothetical protein